VLASARSRGAAEADAVLALQRARERRAARAVVLAAQRAAATELREHAREAVRALLESPGAAEGLAAAVRRRLGPGAVLREHPSGGIVGDTPDGRRVDASVDDLVDGALARLDLERLWTTG
jgi:hypothetical protein